MTVTYKSMLKDRREWQPHAIAKAPLEFSDECLPKTIERALALALHLEMPVGAWVGEATRKDLPISEDARNLLLSNIKDETTHDRAFRQCEKAYPVSDQALAEAANIHQAWMELDAHPLLKAGVCENGVFLVTLAIMNLCGGHSLGRVAANISRDEQRHVATNRSILKALGFNLHQPASAIESLRQQTVAWVFDGFSIANLGIDCDWILGCAEELTRDGYSREMSELTEGAIYTPDFEIEASKLY